MLFLVPAAPASAASGLSFPAAAQFDEGMRISSGILSGSAQRCWSAVYAVKVRANMAWGNGSGEAFAAPFSNGWRYICPADGWDAQGSYFGTTNPNWGYDVGDGPGPYIAVSGGSHKNALRDDSTLYYVMAHEMTHAYYAYYLGTGNSTWNNECLADDTAVALGARDYFGRCV